AISDNGKGISPENLGRIFDPFFTTRRGSGGSGLGLNIVYNIVRQRLGGNIEVHSEVGQGTRFKLEMPCIAPTVQHKENVA
ncbi:ATP-binding protein, partial [Chromobacterium piscinae]